MRVNKHYKTADGYSVHCIGSTTCRAIAHGKPMPVFKCKIKSGPEPSWEGIVVDYHPNGIPFQNRFCREILDND